MTRFGLTGSGLTKFHWKFRYVGQTLSKSSLYTTTNGDWLRLPYHSGYVCSNRRCHMALKIVEGIFLLSGLLQWEWSTFVIERPPMEGVLKGPASIQYITIRTKRQNTLPDIQHTGSINNLTAIDWAQMIKGSLIGNEINKDQRQLWSLSLPPPRW